MRTLPVPLPEIDSREEYLAFIGGDGMSMYGRILRNQYHSYSALSRIDEDALTEHIFLKHPAVSDDDAKKLLMLWGR